MFRMWASKVCLHILHQCSSCMKGDVFKCMHLVMIRCITTGNLPGVPLMKETVTNIWQLNKNQAWLGCHLKGKLWIVREKQVRAKVSLLVICLGVLRPLFHHNCHMLVIADYSSPVRKHVINIHRWVFCFLLPMCWPAQPLSTLPPCWRCTFPRASRPWILHRSHQNLVRYVNNQ